MVFLYFLITNRSLPSQCQLLTQLFCYSDTLKEVIIAWGLKPGGPAFNFNSCFSFFLFLPLLSFFMPTEYGSPRC